MASEIDICNMALSHLGDDATVSSIDPPEGSAQAEHCARFYPMARDTLLDAHHWSFCTTRGTLNQLTAAPASGWVYAYAMPNKALNIIGLFLAGSTDDSQPQEFEVESLTDGTSVIYCNVDAPICRYTWRVTNPTAFPPAVVDALSWLLASMLAGPLIKGAEGAGAAARCLSYYEQQLLPRAKYSDSIQRYGKPTHTPSWMSNR